MSRLPDLVRLQHEKGAIGGTFGGIVKDERAFAVVIGWESMEVSRARVLKSSSMIELSSFRRGSVHLKERVKLCSLLMNFRALRIRSQDYFT